MDKFKKIFQKPTLQKGNEEGVKGGGGDKLQDGAIGDLKVGWGGWKENLEQQIDC